MRHNALIFKVHWTQKSGPNSNNMRPTSRPILMMLMLKFSLGFSTIFWFKIDENPQTMFLQCWVRRPRVRSFSAKLLSRRGRLKSFQAGNCVNRYFSRKHTHLKKRKQSQLLAETLILILDKVIYPDCKCTLEWAGTWNLKTAVTALSKLKIVPFSKTLKSLAVYPNLKANGLKVINI